MTLDQTVKDTTTERGLNPVLGKYASLTEALKAAEELTEKDIIQGALNYCLWNRKKAAKQLGISYSTIHRRIQKYRLDTIPN
ncbi:MAG: helix-turn-helix domain-containing protein [Nanoarchaeota archaeon]